MWESRVAPLSGVVFSVLLLASFLVDANTEFMPPPDDIVSHLETGPVSVMAGAYVRMLGAVALVWFAGSLYKSIEERGNRRLGLLTFGGGILAASLISVGASATLAAAERIQVTGAIETASAAALFDLAGITIGNAAPMGLAILIGATGAALLSSRSQKPWIGWVSVVLALGLVSPYGWVLLAAVLVWVPAAGIWLYRARSDEPVLAGV